MAFKIATPRQRAQVKEVRQKAMNDLRAKQQNDTDGGNQGNYRITVIGQTTGKLRAISSSSRTRTGLTVVNKIDYLRSDRRKGY